MTDRSHWGTVAPLPAWLPFVVVENEVLKLPLLPPPVCTLVWYGVCVGVDTLVWYVVCVGVDTLVWYVVCVGVEPLGTRPG